jgi:hypothetical protein
MSLSRFLETRVPENALVNENPLTDVKHIATRSDVMIRGRWHSNEEIQSRLDTIETYYKNRN